MPTNKDYNTKFDPIDKECPQCGSGLDHATHVELVHSRAVGAPVGKVEGDTVDEWEECLDCGWTSRELDELPEGAQEEWTAAWGNNR